MSTTNAVAIRSGDNEKTASSISSADTQTLTHDMERQPVEADATKAKEEIDAQDPSIVDWDGENDPENPLNWSTSKKFPLMAVISYITMLS